MESSSDTSAYLIEKSKKIKKDSDDILEMVYAQLVDDEPGRSTAAAPAPAPPHAPPNPQPEPRLLSSSPSSGDDLWKDREKAMKVLEFILTYVLSKQYNRESPNITASIEDTINFQKFMVSVESDLNSIISSFKTNWDFFQSVDVEIDWINNTIRIKSKQQ